MNAGSVLNPASVSPIWELNRLLKRVFFLLPLTVFFCAIACVDPFDPKLQSEAKRLVIEAQLTTKLDFQYVYLTYDAPYNSDVSVFRDFVADAKVTLRDNLGNEFAFFDDPNQSNFIKLLTTGYNYRSVNKIQLVVGRTYQLFVETADKKKYESTPEKVIGVPKIEKVSNVFREIKPAAYLTTERGEFKVSITVKDIPNQKNYYRWDWYQIKKLDYCGIGRSAFIICCEVCYEKRPCINCLELGNDNLIDGNSFSRFMTNVPYDANSNYYLVINQYSLTENAYKFWNTVREQSKSSGGLFDPTPKSIIGNFKNVSNANEEVLGYFTVSDIHEEITIIDRNLASPKPFFTEVSYTGPCIPCTESFNRTKIQPKGWQ